MVLYKILGSLEEDSGEASKVGYGIVRFSWVIFGFVRFRNTGLFVSLLSSVNFIFSIIFIKKF